MVDPLVAAEGPADPRLARSRNRLLEAAGQLLATGGVEAVTVEAVTRMSKVARATLYRHFGSTTDLLAATFERLLPPVDTDIDTGPLRERLISLLTTQADLIEQAPVQMTTLAWLAMGPVNSGDASRRSTSDSPSPMVFVPRSSPIKRENRVRRRRRSSRMYSACGCDRSKTLISFVRASSPSSEARMT